MQIQARVRVFSSLLFLLHLTVPFISRICLSQVNRFIYDDAETRDTAAVNWKFCVDLPPLFSLTFHQCSYKGGSYVPFPPPLSVHSWRRLRMTEFEKFKEVSTVAVKGLKWGLFEINLTINLDHSPRVSIADVPAPPPYDVGPCGMTLCLSQEKKEGVLASTHNLTL